MSWRARKRGEVVCARETGGWTGESEQLNGVRDDVIGGSQEHNKNSSGEFDSVEMIMHHIGDSHEWHLCSTEQVESKDKNIFNLLTDDQYFFPKILPDGEYLVLK